MSRAQLQAHQNQVLGPGVLLVEVLLPALEGNSGTFGRLCFDLGGEHGVELTVDLDEGELFDGIDPSADCTVRGPAMAFLALVRGHMEPEVALDAGLMIFGNLAVLEALAQTLEAA